MHLCAHCFLNIMLRDFSYNKLCGGDDDDDIPQSEVGLTNAVELHLSHHRKRICIVCIIVTQKYDNRSSNKSLTLIHAAYNFFIVSIFSLKTN